MPDIGATADGERGVVEEDGGPEIFGRGGRCPFKSKLTDRGIPKKQFGEVSLVNMDWADDGGCTQQIVHVWRKISPKMGPRGLSP